MVIGAQQEKMPHCMAVISRQGAYLYLVQRSGYSGHGILAQRQPQQPRKLIAVHLRVTQKRHELIQHITEYPPQLGILLCRLHLPLLQQFFLPLFQHGRCTGVLRKFVKRFSFTAYRFIGFYPITQGKKQFSDFSSDRVYLGQLFPAIVGHLSAVSIWVCRPVGVPQPHIAPNFPTDHIVFQKIAFRRRQCRHAGLQAAKHILILKAACHCVDGGQQQRQDRLLQNVAPAADIGGNIVPAEHGLQQRAIYLHIPRRHGHLTPANAILCQRSQLRRHILHLGIGGVGLIQGDGRRAARPRFFRAEEVSLQVRKRCVAVTDKVFYFTTTTGVLRQSAQAFPLLYAVVEELRVTVIAQQSHCNSVGLFQRGGNDILLRSVEIGKPINVDIFSA